MSKHCVLQPRISQRKLLNNVYCFVVVFSPSIQAVAESCYYGTEIPLPCMQNLKTGPYFQ